jgi:hypothetical protein
MRLIIAAAAFTALAGCAGHTPDCPVTIGMSEARLTACHPATLINERVSESGTFRVYDARPESPRFIFVRNGVVTGWQAR